MDKLSLKMCDQYVIIIFGIKRFKLQRKRYTLKFTSNRQSDKLLLLLLL